MALRTLEENTAALADVRQAILDAQKAQAYQTGLNQQKTMASLEILYKRENDLLAERQQLQTGGATAGIFKVHGIRRRY